MSLFKASKIIPVAVPDLTPVARKVLQHFDNQGYEVSSDESGAHGCVIGIHKGGIFRAVIGMRTALKLRIATVGSLTEVEASIGILESQGIPTAVAMLAFWPVLVTQTWGLVKQSKLDEEVIAVAEQALLAAQALSGATHFCHECGGKVFAGAVFCTMCGSHL